MRFASITDLAEKAKCRLPSFIWNNLDGAAGDGGGAARNEDAFRSVLFRAHRLKGSLLSTQVNIFGNTYNQPFGIAPVSCADSIWPGTDRAMAKVAAQQQIPLVLSTGASSTVESMAEIAGKMLWFQIYMLGTREASADLIRRAQSAGVEVLVFTVDYTGERRWNQEIRTGNSSWLGSNTARLLDATSHPGWTMRRLLNGPANRVNVESYEQKSRAIFPAQDINAGLDWDDFRYIRDCWSGKLIVKGLMLAEDSIRAIDEGADGVWISNHGGRQLESLPATITVIPEIRAALDPGTPVMVDSGIRCGESILKALALGADIAFSGRSFLYGAGACGPRGVRYAYDILASEVRIGMRQLGCNSPSDLGQHSVSVSNKQGRSGH